MWSSHSCWCPWAVGQRGQQHKAPRPEKPPAAPGARTPCLWQQEEDTSSQDCALQADMELDVERAKELIEQKLAEEEKEEVSP